MKKMFSTLLSALMLMGAFVAPIGAQTPAIQQSISGTTCTATVHTGCAVFGATDRAAVGIQITGTFVGTLQFEQTIDGTTWVSIAMTPNSSTTTVTSTTTTGLWTTSVTNVQVRVRFSAYTSGTAVVYKVSTVSSRGGSGSGGGGGGGAPTDATYVLNTANGSLPNAQDLSALATGLMKVTTGTGLVSSITDSAGVAGSISDETGSGALVFGTSPTLVTPALGTPTAAVLTNATGLPISTGVSGLGASVATFLATPTSANLASALTNETGSGAAVFATSPTLVTPVLGTPTSGTLTNATGLPISTGVSGLGANVATFLGTPSSANLAAAITDETGSGLAVFGTSPTIVTPTIASFTNATHNHTNAAGGGTLAEAALALTDITTANASASAHGFMPKLSGNAFDFATGNGTYSQTMATGTITTSKPWTFTQTLNDGAVTFTGFKVAVTPTASAAGSEYFSVYAGVAGTTCLFAVGGNSACTTGMSLRSNGEVHVAAGGGLNVDAGQINLQTGGYYQWASQAWSHTPSASHISFGSGTTVSEYTINVGAAPTMSGCGTGATISGTGSIGRVTIGTTPGATCTLTFAIAFTTNAPHCDANNETAGSLVLNVTPTTTTVALTAVFSASDKVSYHCIGWQ